MVTRELLEAARARAQESSDPVGAETGEADEQPPEAETGDEQAFEDLGDEDAGARHVTMEELERERQKLAAAKAELAQLKDPEGALEDRIQELVAEGKSRADAVRYIHKFEPQLIDRYIADQNGNHRRLSRTDDRPEAVQNFWNRVAQLEEEKDLSRGEAVQHVAKHEPELHQEFLSAKEGGSE